MWGAWVPEEMSHTQTGTLRLTVYFWFNLKVIGLVKQSLNDWYCQKYQHKIWKIWLLFFSFINKTKLIASLPGHVTGMNSLPQSLTLIGHLKLLIQMLQYSYPYASQHSSIFFVVIMQGLCKHCSTVLFVTTQSPIYSLNVSPSMMTTSSALQGRDGYILPRALCLLWRCTHCLVFTW